MIDGSERAGTGPSRATLSGRPPELAREITAGAVRLAAATAAWLRLIAEFDARGGWHAVGVRSCAHWLAWQCGLGPGAAREHVRVARALRGLPATEVAFAAGRLSYAKVRALTRVTDPTTPTTCDTGCSAGAPNCPTSSCSATPTTASPTTSTCSSPAAPAG